MLAIANYSRRADIISTLFPPGYYFFLYRCTLCNYTHKNIKCWVRKHAISLGPLASGSNPQQVLRLEGSWEFAKTWKLNFFVWTDLFLHLKYCSPLFTLLCFALCFAVSFVARHYTHINMSLVEVSFTTVGQLLFGCKSGMACVPSPSVLIKTVICDSVAHSFELALRAKRRKLTQGQLSCIFFS